MRGSPCATPLRNTGNNTMIDPADFAELQQLVWLYTNVI